MIALAFTSPSHPEGLAGLRLVRSRGVWRARLYLPASHVTLVSPARASPLEAVRALPDYRLHPPEADRLLRVLRAIPPSHLRRYEDETISLLQDTVTAAGFFCFRVE